MSIQRRQRAPSGVPGMGENSESMTFIPRQWAKCMESSIAWSSAFGWPTMRYAWTCAGSAQRDSAAARNKTRRGPAIAAIISRRYSAVEPIEKVDQMKLGLVAQEAGHAQQAVGFQPEIVGGKSYIGGLTSRMRGVIRALRPVPSTSD